MLGTCWYLSNGFEPGTRQKGSPTPSIGTGLLPEGDAKGQPGGILDKVKEQKAKETRPPIDLGNE